MLVRNRSWLAAAVAVAALPAITSAAVYNVNDSAAWTVEKGANSDAIFNYDYSADGIPLAPGATEARAMRLQANTNSGAAVVQGVTVKPNGVDLTGQTYYRIEATAWLNSYGGWSNANTVSSSSGTSQMFGMGVGCPGGVNYRGGTTAAPVGGGSGTWFAASIEGGFGGTSTLIRDYNAFTGSGAVAANFITNPDVYPAAGPTDQDNFDPYYTAQFPAIPVNSINGGTWAAVQGQTSTGDGVITAGVPGFAWRKFVIERDGDTITWSLDGLVIATLTSTDAAPLALEDGAQLTFFDPTSGVAASPNLVFALVSDYTVTVPEPAGLSVLGLGALGLLARRRATR